jgi:hypothetical protein
MIGHRRQRERQIVTLLEGGEGRIPNMVAVMYKGLDPRLIGAAGRSVLAHLIDLQNQGRVAAQGDGWHLVTKREAHIMACQGFVPIARQKTDQSPKLALFRAPKSTT